MTTTIYYYSSTGNSLVIARAVAQALGEAQVLPIARYRKVRTAPGTECVGIIFPVHAWGPPRTVEEFIQNLDLSGVQYTFAIASCGGTAAGTLLKMRKVIRKSGGELHAGFIVRSAGYMAGGEKNPMIGMVRRLSGKPFPAAEERLPEIIECVKSRKHIRPERNALPGAVLGNFFHRMAGPQFARLDASYEVGAACKSCGNCARVCPRGNVSLQDGKPAWQHDCDFCGACATWCPNNAIGFRSMPAVPRRHNMQVQRADFLLT
jgi:ferredoxin/flavodoxin